MDDLKQSLEKYLDIVKSQIQQNIKDIENNAKDRFDLLNKNHKDYVDSQKPFLDMQEKFYKDTQQKIFDINQKIEDANEDTLRRQKQNQDLRIENIELEKLHKQKEANIDFYIK